MRNLLWLVVFLALPTSAAHARDSLWLMCTGNGTEEVKSHNNQPMTLKHGVAVTLFDARFKADQRSDSIDLIFGRRRFSGLVFNLDMAFDKKAGPSALELKEGRNVMFRGQLRVALAAAGSTLTLTGKMRSAYSAGEDLGPFEATLACKDMSDFGDD